MSIDRLETALSRNRSKLVRVYKGDPPDPPELGLSGRSSRPTSPKYPRLRSIDSIAGLCSLCATSIETRYARVRVGRISIFTRPKTNPDEEALCCVHPVMEVIRIKLAESERRRFGKSESISGKSGCVGHCDFTELLICRLCTIDIRSEMSCLEHLQAYNL
jgi:hypothetical protein